MQEKICGIYKITSPSGRVYIGKSVDINSRFRDYNSNSKKLKRQIRLYNSFLKHGVENHTFEIIEECEKINLYRRERFWQLHYDVLNREKGLNCMINADEDHPMELCEETRKRRSESRSGLKSKVIKPVVCTKTLKEWYSAKVCAEENDIPVETLYGKLTGRYINNTSFIYVEDWEERDTKANQKNKNNKGSNNGMYGRKGASAPNSKRVICDLTGKIWESCRQCAEDNNICDKLLSSKLVGTNKNNTTFRYL